MNGVQRVHFFYMHIEPLPHHPPNLIDAFVSAYEVEVDPPNSTVRLVLWDWHHIFILEDGEQKAINYSTYVHDETLSLLARQAKEGDLRCHVQQARHGHVDARPLTEPYTAMPWTRPRITEIPNDSFNWLECPYDPALGPPTGFQLLHRSVRGVWSVQERAICEYRLPRTFATGLIKGLYFDATNQLHRVYDYIGYCLRLGIDFFYVIDQTPDQRLLAPFKPLLQRGLAHYIWWPDAEFIASQYPQTAVYHVWSAAHTRYAYAADFDEYIALPTTPFVKRDCVLGDCASPLRTLLTTERYSKWTALELFCIIMPLWPVPPEERARHPEDDFRYDYNDSVSRGLSYSGRRADPAYLPHVARAIYHSTEPPFANDRKTIYLAANVTFSRPHDVFPIRGYHAVLRNTSDARYLGDIHIRHYRHINALRPLQLPHDNDPKLFWQHAKRDTLISDLVLHAPYPTSIEDFLTWYPTN